MSPNLNMFVQIYVLKMIDLAVMSMCFQKFVLIYFV